MKDIVKEIKYLGNMNIESECFKTDLKLNSV